MSSLTFEIPDPLAKEYAAFSPDERQELLLRMAANFGEIAARRRPPQETRAAFDQAVAELRREAARSGLTEEVLRKILNDRS